MFLAACTPASPGPTDEHDGRECSASERALGLDEETPVGTPRELLATSLGDHQFDATWAVQHGHLGSREGPPVTGVELEGDVSLSLTLSGTPEAIVLSSHPKDDACETWEYRVRFSGLRLRATTDEGRVDIEFGDASLVAFSSALARVYAEGPSLPIEGLELPDCADFRMQVQASLGSALRTNDGTEARLDGFGAVCGKQAARAALRPNERSGPPGRHFVLLEAREP